MNAGLKPEIGRGLFPLPEAARLARLNLQTARRWAESSPPVMRPALPMIGGHQDLTFADMLTLCVVKQLTSTGLRLPTIKWVAERAAMDFDSPNPFISRHFRTDGRRVFNEIKEQAAANDEPRLSPREREVIKVLTEQRQFADLVAPFFRDLDWEDDTAARWWPLTQARSILLDPGVIFGAPHIAGTRIPTEPVAAAIRAEGGGPGAVGAAADWFGISAEQACDALQFEDDWPRRAA